MIYKSRNLYIIALCCRKWVERLCKLMERYGTDYWWELSTEKLIGRDLRQELNNNIDDLEKGMVRIIEDLSIHSIECQ